MRVGLTGGPATGKSTILRALSDLGARTVSADALVAELWADPRWEMRIWEALGSEGPMSRAEVRLLILEDLEARRRLNALLHEPVWEKILESGADVVEVPLLIEAGLVGAFESIWVASCGEAVQRERLLARLGDRALTDGFLASQLPLRAKIAFADVVIRTDEPLDSVLESVRAAAISAELL
jgi:dephospho-CoA kinase